MIRGLAERVLSFLQMISISYVNYFLDVYMCGVARKKGEICKHEKDLFTMMKKDDEW